MSGSRVVAIYKSGSVVLTNEGEKDEHFYCTCTAWKMQKIEPKLRTCKHLKLYVGNGLKGYTQTPVTAEDDWEKELQQAAESLSRMMR